MIDFWLRQVLLVLMLLGCSHHNYAAVNVNSVTPLVRGRREFDVESWGAKYFFIVDFLANPLKLCAVNSLNTWVLIVFIFVEFLLSYLLSARRIQNIGLRSPPQMRNARIASYTVAGVLVVYWKLPLLVSRNTKWMIFICNHAVTLVSNTWPFFHNSEKMVSSEPSNLRNNQFQKPWGTDTEFTLTAALLVLHVVRKLETCGN
jgi:phosphatidylglycerophosphate synthase